MSGDDENKTAIIFTAAVTLAIVLVGGGFWLGHQHSNTTDSNAAVSSSNTSDSSLTSLSVNGSGATNLGQLGGSGSQTGVQNSQSSSGSSSNSSPDASTSFAQYDKYKNSSSALFGDIQVGTGATLGANQKATITYKGWLTDGTLFDQSQANSSGQLVPYVFTLGTNQVIPGLQEGIDGMKVGGSRLVIVPPSVGYGSQGQKPIPPNAVLVFEVNLLDVN
jgi:FKBP-type peptidyl-prolyl cis-trans isomerase FkpA